MPQTAIVFLVGTLSLAGIPLFGGLLLEGGDPGRGAGRAASRCPFWMLVTAAFLTAFYMFRVVFIAFFGAPGGARARWRTAARRPRRATLHDAPAVMTLPLWLLAALVGGHRRVLHRRITGRPSSQRRAGSRPLAVAVAVGGIALAWLDYSRRVISADRPRRDLRPIRRGRARALLAATTSSTPIYRAALLGCLAARRLGGPLPRGRHRERAAARGRSPAGDRLRRIQTGHAAGLRLRRRGRAPAPASSGSSGRDEPAFPMLSMITWTPFLGAAPHHVPGAAAQRRSGAAGSRWSTTADLARCSRSRIYVALRPRGGGLPVLRGAAAGARRSASATSSAWTA